LYKDRRGIVRSVNYQVTCEKLMPVTVDVVIERIANIYEDKLSSNITVTIQSLDSEGAVVSEKQKCIVAEAYNILLSANPDFAPGKPENEYREADIFYVLDNYVQRGI
jgi:hypothetical protein